MQDRVYIAIDLKSFYASVECVARGLDPMTTNLVVADESRTEKTICLAVSPALRQYGIPGRARLFEVVQRVKQVNALRKQKAPGQKLDGSAADTNLLHENSSLALDFIIAPPQMERYMQCSAGVYQNYLKFFSPEDIHVYSIDEVFIDATNYLNTYRLPARELAVRVVREVYQNTGITATVGIGTNLYLSKIAMDIVAKRMPPDYEGVRVAELNEMSYRRLLWGHTPLTDFWRVGRGISAKLEKNGIKTMGDIARCSLHNEELLYRLFGVNAELLIDHAWGWEPCTIKDIKSYKTESKSVSSGQVLAQPYDSEKGKLIVREMTDLLSLDLVDKGLVTDQMVLTVGYDISNASKEGETEELTTDYYGRKLPKQAHGSINLGKHTASTKLITDAVMQLYDRIVNKKLLVRRMYVVANHVLQEKDIIDETAQLNLFSEYTATGEDASKKEKKVQKAVLSIQKKYGKNAILKGMNLQEGATTVERNRQVGGHKK